MRDTSDSHSADAVGVSVTRTSKPFVLLRPVEHPWKPEVDPTDVIVGASARGMRGHLSGIELAECLAIDLETKGGDFSHPDSRIVGVGLAWRTGDEVCAKYFAYDQVDDEARRALWRQVRTVNCPVIAFNLIFDGAWIEKECLRLGVRPPRWTHCAYALYRQLATEGFPGQTWNLKDAQIDQLGWTETNEKGIDEWLIAHGYHKGGPGKKIRAQLLKEYGRELTPEEWLAACRKWVAEGTNPAKPRTVRPMKAEMWRVPPEILGAYCILDCVSTLQLFEDVLMPVACGFPELLEFHEDIFVAADKLLWRQQGTGIPIHMDKMRAHGEFLRQKLEEATAALRAHPVLGPRISSVDERYRKEMAAKEPTKFKVKRERIEPRKFTRGGKIAKAWETWNEWLNAPPTTTKNWDKWRARMDAWERGELPKLRFNPGSDDQMLWLLYGDETKAGPVKWRATDKKRKKKGVEIPVFEIYGVHEWVELDGTDTGNLPVNADLFSQLPDDMKEPLQLYADASQELSFVEKYLACARLHDDGIWRVHPGWISPGTLTRRLAGKDPNFQQAPKTIEFLECFYAEPSWVWVEKDWSALEPHTLAEVSRDPALLKLYGPGAKKHDVYLYSGAHYAVLGDEVRKYYDVEEPDVAHAKKNLKTLRDKVLKTVVLSKQYGSGAANIHQKIRLSGYNLSFEQAKQISDSHEEMYYVSGRELHEKLEAEWHARGGWILSALGHPIAVYERKKKDLINRCIQTSAHDCHTMYYVDVARRLRAEKIPFKGIIWDFHDQLIFAVPEEFGARAIEILNEAEAALNERLGAYVKLKGEPKLCHDMARAKEAETSWRARQ